MHGAAALVTGEARAVPAPAATARRTAAAPATAARGGPAVPGTRARAVPVPAASARAHGVAPDLAGRAVDPGPVRPAPSVRACGPLRRPGARATRIRPGSSLLVLRRRPVPWAVLPRERLLAAWARLLRDHRALPDDLRLLGVYGPLPLDAVASVVLDPRDDEVLVTLRRTRAPGPSGDVALARDGTSHRLLQSRVPSGAPPRRPRRR